MKQSLATESDIVLDKEQLAKVRQLIYRETGMLFEEGKNYYIESRIKQRMLQVNADDFNEYYHDIVFGDRKGEIKEFIESITINETYFFRDFPQLQGFAESVLPAYIDGKKKKGSQDLRIWSAASSTGEEPYTLSIIAQEMIEDSKRWKISVDATDIDRKVLQFAQTGVYGERSMKDTPPEYRLKYFQRSGEGWKVQPNCSNIVNFKELNFMDRTEMRKMKGYDFIFCRNVLIYFDDESRKKVVSQLYDALVPGGYLFLGHSESVGRITAAFTLEKIDDFLCYRKPL